MAERLEIEIIVDTKGASPKVATLQGNIKDLGAVAGQADDVIGTALNPSLAGLASLSAAGGPVLIALAAAIAVVAAGAAAMAVALKEAFAAEVEIAQLNAVLKSTGQIAGISADAAQDLASELSALSGISDETILAGESMMLTFQNIGKKTFPDAMRTALDLSVAFGQDLQQSVMTLGKALENPIEGMTALTRVGVSFSESQKQMITSMVEGGRAAQAQAYILKLVNQQVAGSAEALGSTTIGEWNKIKNIIGNAAESVGGVFIPYLNSAMGNLRILMEGMFEGLEPGLREISKAFDKLGKELRKPEMREAIKQLGEQIGEMIAEGLPEMLKNITNNVEQFAKVWATEGPEIISTITDILEIIETLDSALRSISTGIQFWGGGGFGAFNNFFASGVTNFSGGMAVVGERGPETVVLPRGSSVLPDGGAAARQASGGITIYGGVQVTQARGATLTDLLRGTNIMRMGTT